MHWGENEVVAYIEEKMKDGISTYGEEMVYQFYNINRKINTKSKVYKKLIREMNTYFEGK